MRILKWTLFIVLLLGATAGGYAYWRHQERYPTTDDAYVHAHVVHIAAQVQGPVSQVFVHNFHEVKKGEALFDIDP